jgi:hypothetical protein
MSLELKRRKGSKRWYLRGTVRGQSVFETTACGQEVYPDSGKCYLTNDLSPHFCEMNEINVRALRESPTGCDDLNWTYGPI